MSTWALVEALMPQKATLKLLMLWRVPADELFRLDTVQCEWFSILHACRYVGISYGITRVLLKWIPALRMLEQRRNAIKGQRILSSVSTIPAAIATYFIKSWSYTLISPYVCKALAIGEPLRWFDVFGKILRGMHYAGLRMMFRSPAAVAASINATVAKAQPVKVVRTILSYTACEAYIGRFLRFMQPLGTLNAFRICDSLNPLAMGTNQRGHPRLSKKVTTSGTFERFGITTHDMACAIASYYVNEYITSFIQFGIIGKIQHGKFEWQFERHTVNLLIRCGLLLGVLNPLLNKILGPTAVVSSAVGLRVPTAFIAYLTFSLVDALISTSIYNKYLSCRCAVRHARTLLKMQGRYQKACKQAGKKERLNRSQIYNKYRCEEYQKLFATLVGTDYETLSQSELTGIRDFSALHYISGVEGFPLNTDIELGLISLAAIVIRMETLSVGGGKDNVVLERALRAGTLQRINVSDLMAPILPAPESMVDLSGSPGVSRQNSTLNLTQMEDDPCPICLRQLKKSDEDIVIGSSCGHAYHTGCMRDCLRVNTGCPLCRSNLAPNDSNFAVPAVLGPEAPRPDDPSNVLELAFNGTAVHILTKSGEVFSRFKHWGRNHDLLVNYLMNKAAKGSTELRELLTVVTKLDKAHQNKVSEAIDKSVRKEIKPYVGVAKFALDIFSCPVIFFIEPSLVPLE